MRNRTRAVLVALAWPWLAAAEGEAAPSAPEPAKTPAASEAALPGAPGAPPVTASGLAPAPSLHPAAAEPSWKNRFSVEVGWGYYEVTHVGVGWHLADTAVLDLFAGGGLAWDARTVSVGLGFRHDLFPRFWNVQAGWDVKTLYWTQSDSSYDWKNMSVVFGGYVVRELDSRLAIKVDGGAALSFALQSDRKQNQTFGSPQRWNGSVCVELVYRLGS